MEEFDKIHRYIDSFIVIKYESIINLNFIFGNL